MSKGKPRKPRTAKPKSEGLGDTIAKITQATGIKKAVELWEAKTGKDCGCEERRKILNKLIKYARTINCMTLSQYDRWTKEREIIAGQVKRNTIEMPQLTAIYEIHRAVYGLPLEMPCMTCTKSYKLWLSMVEQLEAIWRTYTPE
jgi:hypothetical protein